MPDPLRWSDGTKWVSKESGERWRAAIASGDVDPGGFVARRPVSGLRPPTPSDLTDADRALLAGCGIVWP